MQVNRNALSILALVLALHASFLFGKAASPAQWEPAEVKNLFVPDGFDDNDEVVVVVDGYLPDPCHKLKPSRVRIDGATKSIVVSPMMERFTGACPDVIVPFQTVISLGVLEKGKYTVETARGGQRDALLVKVAANPGPDDYLYAPIDGATVTRRTTGHFAVLKGRLTDTCLEFADVRVIDSGRTFEVLPILRMNATDPHGRKCRAEERPFERVVQLPPLDEGRYLLHVRSMNGQSVNEVFQTYW